MVLLKEDSKTWLQWRILIYIPIWFYWRNFDWLIKDANMANLHSNMVLLKEGGKASLHHLDLAFTFQYGSTEGGWRTVRCVNKRYLHSNMVLLKECPYQPSFFLQRIYIPIWFYWRESNFAFFNLRQEAFTFQYGSTEGPLQIHLLICILQNLHSNMVLLKV